MSKNKRIFVDLSATILHHGHIRLLKKAKKFGKVYVGLSLDKEVKKYKGYLPELNYNQRKEIISSIKYVYKVIPSKWKITDKFLLNHKFSMIIRGSDHKKDKFKIKTIVFPRTKGVSSKLIRKKAFKIVKEIY